MLFALHCHDKPGHAHVRAETREAHLEYANAHRSSIYVGGPTLSDDGDGMTGSLIILDVADKAEAEEFATNDPYGKAGLFESVTIQAWKEVFAPEI